MSTKKLQLAGTQDFDPPTMLKRQYIINNLQNTFKQYGFLPIQTPAIEHLDTLTGKYGEDQDKLIFKILNSGNFLAKTTYKDYEEGHKTLSKKIAEKALIYDLTVPLGRYIFEHLHDIHFPFKRYQIQPVYRADKPQKNRYKEFFQCDVDIVGGQSLLYEAEMLAMINKITTGLRLENTTIQLNHRLIIKALALYVQAPEQEQNLCTALDKLDKINKEGVLSILHKQGLTRQQTKKIDWVFSLPNNINNTLEVLNLHLGGYLPAQTAISDIKKILHYTQILNLPQQHIVLNPTLARGLDYYTGSIFELKVTGSKTSIGGGGRYNNLTTLFGLEPKPSIGFSFGLERLYNTLQQQNLLPNHIFTITQLLIAPLSEAEEDLALKYLFQLRQKHNISAEMLPSEKRIKKALNYANKKNIPWLIIIGEEERKKNMLSLKHLPTHQQIKCTFPELLKKIKKTLNN